jgi:hypothetical protein
MFGSFDNRPSRVAPAEDWFGLLNHGLGITPLAKKPFGSLDDFLWRFAFVHDSQLFLSAGYRNRIALS